MRSLVTSILVIIAMVSVVFVDPVGAQDDEPEGLAGRRLCQSGDGMPYRGDILPYLRATEDVTVPPGRYSIGDAAVAGEQYEVDENRDSWVTVKADIPGTVVVDGAMNQAGLMFVGDGSGAAKRSQKLILAGIHFTGVSVKFESTQNISFWYTCHEYTPRQWHENAMAAAANAGVELPANGPKDPHGDGGGLYALEHDGPEWQQIADKMGSFLPTGLRGGATAAGASRHLRFFGVDVGPVADDGIYMGSTWNVVIQGARIHNVSELYLQPDGDAISVDPGPVYGDESDQFHNDGIQIGRAGYEPTVLDSWVTNRIMFNKLPTTARSGWDMIVRRSWFGSTPQVNTGGLDQVAALTEDPNFADWHLGNAGGPWRSEAIAVIAADHGSSPPQMSAEFSDLVYIAHRGSDFKFSIDDIDNPGANDFPNLEISNISTTSLGLGHRDIFTNSGFIAHHPDNPALRWRAQHPYLQVDTYDGLTTSSFTDPGAPSGPTDPIGGNVNCNAALDISDALMIAQFTVSTRSDSGGCPLDGSDRDLNLAAADVNGDGVVTMGDALLVAQCSVGLPNIACPGD